MNAHATIVALGPLGFLIEGPSGFGKTALALAAIKNTKQGGVFAALVADDQCLIEVAHNRLIASCPPALQGLAEIRGLGITSQPFIASSIVDWVIRLVEQEQIDRIPDPLEMTILGVDVPLLKLPARQIAMNLPILDELIHNRRF